MVLRWDNLTLNYQFYGRRTIHGVSGHVHRGECHLLTSDQAPLIDCLLQTLTEWRVSPQERGGDITWNGHVCRPHEWLSRIGLVPCDAPLENEFTVREYLLRSIYLRRWDVVSRKEGKRLAGEALEFFQLEHIADKSVGSLYGSSQASAVDRKLFLTALEYMGRPEVMFIETESPGGEEDVGEGWCLLSDEEIAHYCDILRKLAKERNIAIIMSTRNAKLLRAFKYDSASLFLNGKPIYSGPTEGLEEILPQSLEALVRGMASSPIELERRNKLVAALPTRMYRRYSMMEELCDTIVSRRPCPWWANLLILTQSQIRGDVRSRKHVASLVISFSIIYTLLAFVYFQLPLDLDGLIDRGGLFLYISFNLLLMTSLPKLVRFQLELKKITHDYRLNLIWSPGFVLAQFIAALPMRLILVTILGTAVYYITGLRTDGFQHYIVFMADLYLMVGTSLSLGIFVAAAIPRIEYSQLVIPFLVIIFFQYGNLSIGSSPTWILRWIQYISPVFYSFQCLMQNELQGATADDGTDIKQFLDQGYSQMPIAACLPALAGFIIIYLMLACIATHLRFVFGRWGKL